jgi:polysaccharide pyruvyl transferase WcaK-like protein
MKQLPRRARWTAFIPGWLRKRRALSLMQRQSRELQQPWRDTAAPRMPPARLFIIPPDTDTLIGARGDEAMVLAIAESLRERRADLHVSVLVGSVPAETAARRIGFEPVRYSPSFIGVIQAIRGSRPDALVVIGADMMDGYYSPTTSAMRLLAADRLTRDGVPSIVSGFSFNAHPDPLLASVFDALDPRVRLCVRDPLSLTRLRGFCKASPTLVADPAFLLRPDSTSSRVAQIGDWIARRRRSGDRVFGINLHPSLFPDAPADQHRLTQAVAAALTSIAGSEAVSWLLLAHDFRSERSCGVSLAQVECVAGERLGERLLRPTEALSAAELKAVTGALDGVFAGRMHLAIAALGQGTPIACLTYQGKFQGLLEHFALPHRLALSPRDALREGAVEAVLRHFMAEAVAYRQRIAQRLPGIIALSEQNLEPLLCVDRSSRRAAESIAST